MLTGEMNDTTDSVRQDIISYCGNSSRQCRCQSSRACLTTNHHVSDMVCRVMNSKWRTFKTNTLAEDAVVFLWDILYQVGTSRYYQGKG